MIPRILHQIWLGGHPLPARYVGFRESFRQLNPGWSFRLWTEKELRAAEMFPFVPGGYNCQSNVVRLLVLYTIGGVYVDMDVECVKSLEPLLASDIGFCGWQSEGSLVCNAVCGASPGSRWIRRLLDSLPNYVHRQPPWGPRHMSDNLLKSVTVHPKPAFYPFSFDEPPCGPTPETFMIHHWDKLWAAGPQFFTTRPHKPLAVNRPQAS